MPWPSGGEFAEKHNKALVGHPAAAQKAADQATAVLNKTGDEGLAIAVANKSAKRARTSGLIAKRQKGSK